MSNVPSVSVPRRLAAALLGAGVVGILTAAPAAAHAGHEQDGLVGGALHPVGGVDHVLAMVAVGVLAVLAAKRLPVWSLPVAFVAGMVGGAALGYAGVPLAGVELLIAGSVVVAGLAVAGAFGGRVPAPWLVAAVTVAGAVHGHAHGAEAPGSGSAALYVLGFVGATVALHALGALGGLVARRSPVVRALAGAAVAGAGLMLLSA